MNKRLLNVLVAFLTVVAAFAGSNALKIVPAIGEPLVLLFADRPAMSFDGDDLVVSGGGLDAAVHFAISGIRGCDFIDTTGGSVSEADAMADITVRHSDGTLYIANLPADSQIALFALDGAALARLEACGDAEIDTSALKAGVYILQINKNALKLYIK